MKKQTEDGIKEVLNFLELGNPSQARQIVTKLFEDDLESKELSYTNRCCTFWIDANKRLSEISDPFEKGEKLLNDWKSFQSFLEREHFVYEPALFSVQKGFFSSTLEIFNSLLEEKDPLRKAEIYRNAGICYKKTGDFEKARASLSEANNCYPSLASVLAELADCYALCGEEKYGKVLFREAFFLDPEKIDLDYLDSELIKCLISKAKEKGFTGKVLQHWIPVYGVLCGIFNIKRTLTSQEVCRLKQNIYAMENEYKDPSCNVQIITPRLLNSYFWLIDYYVLTHENVKKINEILLKIKILDSNIYNAYVK